MDASSYYQWQPVNEASGSSSSLDGWAKEPSRTPSAGVHGSGGTAAAPSEQMTLEELLGTIDPPAQSQYFQQFSHGQYMAPANSAPYNAIPYGTAWASAPNHVPLSSYSSLNGATSTGQATTTRLTTEAQPPQRMQQHSPPPIIDPSLSNTNHYSPPPSTPTYATQSQQSRQQLYISLQQHLSHGNNPYFHQHSFPQLAQSSLASQGTLAPQALHSPSAAPMMGIVPSHFYGTQQQQQQQSTPPPPQGPTPEELKEKFVASIKPHLASSSFTGAGAVNTLVTKIDDYGIQTVDAATRLEILTKIRDGAGNHYFRAWSENPTAMDISREWLKAPLTSDDEDLIDTIMPLLHILDRLPLSLENLKASKLGKLIVKLSKNPPSPAIKDMASNIERRWRSLLDGQNGKEEEPKSKKRKMESGPPLAKSTVPAKKAAPIVTKAAPVGKKTPVTASTGVAKSDSSFFSEKKPKKLPKFTKAPVVKKDDSNIALPSSIDPFQEALKLMGKRKEATATPPIQAFDSSGTLESGRPSKKKKTVQWVPDKDLEAVRYIEKAIYDGDAENMHEMIDLRKMEKGEGAALHRMKDFEESIDYYEPTLIKMPDDIEYKDRGLESQERDMQTHREESALIAVYLASLQIPPSPAEPSTLTEPATDDQIPTMTVGPDLENTFWNTDAMMAHTDVASLVAQLTAPMNGGENIVPSLDPNAAAAALSAIPPDQLQSLLQQLNPNAMLNSNGFGMSGSGGSDPNWGNPGVYPSEFGQGYTDDSARWDSSGRGGRGRGRGRGRGGYEGGHRTSKRKPCSFFQSGRCKFGDQCDFAHEFAS